MSGERVAEYRRQFGQIAGQVIKAFAVKTAASKQPGEIHKTVEDVAELQVLLAVICQYEREKYKEQYESTEEKTNLYGVASIEQAQGIIAGIKREGEEERDKIEGIEAGIRKAAADTTKQWWPPKGTPVFGKLAVKLGVVPQETMDVLLRLQAAERVAEVAEGKGVGRPAKTVEAIITNYKLPGDATAEDKMFARPYIGGRRDPAEVVQAQALNHLADMVVGFCADAWIPWDKRVKVIDAKNLLLDLSAYLYEQAGRYLKGLEKNGGIKQEANGAIEAIVSSLKGGKEQEFDFASAINTIEEGLNAMVAYCKGCDTEEARALGERLEEIVKERLVQARGQKVEQERGAPAGEASKGRDEAAKAAVREQEAAGGGVGGRTDL